MEAKKLAERLVELKIIKHDDTYPDLYEGLDPLPAAWSAEVIVNDWRTAGASLDMCFDRDIVLAHITDDAMRNIGEYLSRAITEACVKFLS